MEKISSIESDDWIQQMKEDLDKTFKNNPELKIYKTGTF